MNLKKLMEISKCMSKAVQASTFPLGFCSLRVHFQSFWIPFDPRAKRPTPEFVYSSLTTWMVCKNWAMWEIIYKITKNLNMQQTLYEESALSGMVTDRQLAGSTISANCQGLALSIASSTVLGLSKFLPKPSTPFFRKWWINQDSQ